MVVLQAHQADLLKDLDEKEEEESNIVAKLHQATDLSPWATKETAKAIGHPLALMVATERHLWMNLSDLQDKHKISGGRKNRGWGDALSVGVFETENGSADRYFIKENLDKAKG